MDLFHIYCMHICIVIIMMMNDDDVVVDDMID